MTSNNKQPSYASIVQLLCVKKCIEETEEKLPDGTTKLIKKEVRFCPSGANFCKNKDGLISFVHKTGFRNPFSHLVSCIGKGDESKVYQYYEKILEENNKKQDTIDQHLIVPSLPMTTKDKELHEWVLMIITKTWPLNCVKDPEYRQVLKHKNVFSIMTITQVILKLSTLVKEKISNEMKNAGYGAIMHDRWTKFSVHYCGLYATFNHKTQQKFGNQQKTIIEPILVLLVMSPLYEIVEPDTSDVDTPEDKIEESEVSSFTAEAHVQFFQKIFQDYGCVLRDWAVCQTADNCSVNRKIAKLLEIPHIPCSNHLLNSEVNELYNTTKNEAYEHHGDGIGTILDSIHKTMVSIKSSIKNAAVLRKLTDLTPIIGNRTKWTGWSKMVSRFVEIRDSLIEASMHENANIPIDDSISSVAFLKKSEKISKMFIDINAATVSLQERLLKVSECRKILDDIVEESNEQYSNGNSHWFQNKLGEKYIGQNSNRLPDPAFLSGVCKIQDNMTSSMSKEEQDACKHLLIASTDNNKKTEKDNLSLAERIKEQTRKRKACEMNQQSNSIYKNVDFVCGSAAEVERLWSECRYVLSSERAKMSPELFEGIMFLQTNRVFWNNRTTQEALSLCVKENKQKQAPEK